uniref:Uncharacterized protein n=1 Tax=Setaria viridis TaxID=4556 RepID=A0A4U6UIN9_SETVI|nr:hypothetical protein SEVIR_5G142975v2 [Setaria viridis]
MGQRVHCDFTILGMLVLQVRIHMVTTLRGLA